jgi:hypothetical protein
VVWNMNFMTVSSSPSKDWGVFGMVVSLFAKISCRLVGSTSNCPRGGLKPCEGSPPSNWHRPGQTRVGRLVSSKAVLRVYDGLC